MELAGEPEEVAALAKRYESVLSDAVNRGCAEAVVEFENAVSSSEAVVTCPFLEFSRLAASDREIYATFYEKSRAPIRLPTGGKWDVLRNAVDGALFPGEGFRDRIRFAALTLDGRGLPNYGDAWLILADHMIEHRASVFESNSVVWAIRRKMAVEELTDWPKGYRARWEERGKLSAVKLAGAIGARTPLAEHGALLLKGGATGRDDEFVEVHVYGTMTRRTLARVSVPQRSRKGQRALLLALKEGLEEAGVEMELR